ncbi:hypothetical protein AGR3A_Cc190006 [Agrobacterium tomkonis CFBP 6623]|uniref:Uncharacterized protein n=1 Tax=Agrobacterium tomkonis CFBP 6623 TaxID=1183432 RepID=A0A1S7NZP0_9HYPH|nr:hypothetical protein AGR3A_Cc190006 [Agrobacterium tomkonis CFBP 6623]
MRRRSGEQGLMKGNGRTVVITRSWFVHFAKRPIEFTWEFFDLPNRCGHSAAFDLGTFPDRAQKSPPERASKRQNVRLR